MNADNKLLSFPAKEGVVGPIVPPGEERMKPEFRAALTHAKAMRAALLKLAETTSKSGDPLGAYLHNEALRSVQGWDLWIEQIQALHESACHLFDLREALTNGSQSLLDAEVAVIPEPLP